MIHDSDNDNACIHLLPYHVDPLEYLAADIINRHGSNLPILDDIIVLMPGVASGRHLRNCLGEVGERQGFTALLGPTITSLTAFITANSTVPATLLSQPERELKLVEALRAHPDLYGQGSPWLMAEDLLQLFDELTLYQSHIPDSLDAFRDAIRDAYQLTHTVSQDIENQLDHESRLVHTLWQAWQQQLRTDQLLESKTLYCKNLLDFNHKPGQFFYLVGYTNLLPAEQAWFNQLAEQGQALHIIQGKAGCDDGQYHPDAAIATLLESNTCQVIDHDNVPAASRCLTDMFADNALDIGERAHRFSQTVTSSPLKEHLQILTAENPEQQALGIELQIRQWLHEGKKSIGVITEDRRLSRRLRALLERVNIPLQDSGGWALSTTRAAAALERWLECLEQDFDHLPLLDLLKSPFIFPEQDTEQRLYTVYRFEQDIVRHENIARSLYRYRRQVDYRAERLAEIWRPETRRHIHSLIDELENASKSLTGMVITGKHRPVEFLEQLILAMQTLGMYASFETDAAGQAILAEFDSLRHTLADNSFVMNWLEFRGWLGRTLERATFRPGSTSSPVQLLDPGNSDLAHFDAIIIAAADSEHLPGRTSPHAFFNDAVRRALGLPGKLQHVTHQFYRFRCLLESADNILMSYHSNENGSDILPSPWLEVIRHYHDMAWQDRLEHETLGQWLASGYAGYVESDTGVPVTTTQAFTATPSRPELLPARISASAYQQLVDCPYKFFMARGLHIQASDEVREVLEKSDYGNRVHSCLEAFHTDMPNLPGPFSSTVTAANRDAAIECLVEISRAVFARELEDNFLHRGWLHRWQNLIPAYIDWQIRRTARWQVSATEQHCEQPFHEHALHGFIDRIDKHEDEQAIIDYKTGSIPSNKDIAEGEAVQLPFYALITDEPVHRIEYLALDGDKVETRGYLEGDALDELVHAQSARLEELLTGLQQHADLRAWGDSKACKYCEMDGLCRREASEPETDTQS